MKNKRVFIEIAGPAGSGKTTIKKNVEDLLITKKIAVCKSRIKKFDLLLLRSILKAIFNLKLLYIFLKISIEINPIKIKEYIIIIKILYLLEIKQSYYEYKSGVFIDDNGSIHTLRLILSKGKKGINDIPSLDKYCKSAKLPDIIFILDVDIINYYRLLEREKKKEMVIKNKARYFFIKRLVEVMKQKSKPIEEILKLCELLNNKLFQPPLKREHLEIIAKSNCCKTYKKAQHVDIADKISCFDEGMKVIVLNNRADEDLVVNVNLIVKYIEDYL